MRRKTTTQQLQNAITSNLLQVVKAEIHHKSSKQVDILSIDSFKESLEFLAETIFSNMLDWNYERNFNSDGGYIVDSGYRNQYSEDIVIVYMSIANGVSSENIERTLLFSEEV